MSAPPNEFVCPITLQIMEDPVMLSDGHTYEREAIARALSVNPISPLTREPMTMESARVNYALKSLIAAWLQNNSPGDIPPPPAPAPAPREIIPVELDEFTANYTADPDDSTFDFLHVVIQPKKLQARRPLALIALIDVSGSMEMNACENVAGFEDVDLSRLQLVKHALKTIVATLGDSDELVLVTFSQSADLIFGATKMSTAGKARATSAIDGMRETGATNIWDALRVGMGEAQKFRGRDFNTSILLFTDGEPNRNPPMGIIPALEESLTAIDVNFSISSFGFGYNIDSPLMEDIAKLGNGVYGYCPDCTMVGTVFINFMASLLSTYAQNVRVDIRNPKYQVKHIVALPNGGSRNLLVRIPAEKIAETKIEVSVGSAKFTLDKVSPVAAENLTRTVDQIYRLKLMNLIENGLNSLAEAPQKVKALFEEIKGIKWKTPFLEKILIDLVSEDENHGQIERAFRQDYFAKWGNNYLRSFLRFHSMEQCGNFKDQSLQDYATAEFEAIRTVANTIFLNLPPPESRPVRRGGRYSSGNAGPISMSRMYSQSVGCIAGDCRVDLKSGRKLLRELTKGDVLVDGGIVECLLETIVPPGELSDISVIGDAILTPYHPIQVHGQWVFPCSIAPIIQAEIPSWFNLVVRGNKVVRVEGVSAITLAHGMADGVLAHPYFGTTAIVEDLAKYPGFSGGHVRVPKPVNVLRNEDGMIVKAF